LASVTGAAFVADEDGVGTTLYTAPHGSFTPRFGPRSRQAHLETGAQEVGGRLLSLRRDVDDKDALAAATSLGVGPHTRLALLS
jgi:2-phospho-L-lactate/phosphoenolpyruvate guanylyltransferase